MVFSLSAGKAGIIGATCAILFFVIVIALGLFQPQYNHLKNTISALVVGELGWIQTLNFLVFALSFIFVGFGLGKNITGRNLNYIWSIFLIFAFIAILVAFMPISSINEEVIRFQNASQVSAIHHFVVLGIIIVVPFILLPLVKAMSITPDWKPFVPYTLGMILFNLAVGILWYVLINYSFFDDWKGLVQKILATNVLIWLVVIGHRLWKIENDGPRKCIVNTNK